MTRKGITLEFVVPTLLAVALAIVLFDRRAEPGRGAKRAISKKRSPRFAGSVG